MNNAIRSISRLLGFAVLLAAIAGPGCGGDNSPSDAWDSTMDDADPEVSDSGIGDQSTGDAHDDSVVTGDSGPDDVGPADAAETYDAVDPDFFRYNDVPTFCVAGLDCVFAFSINATPDNPFDPDEIDIKATITTSTGATYVRPAYYWIPFQDYGGRPGPAMEPASWAVSFLPDGGGEWSIEVVAHYQGRPHILPPLYFPIEGESDRQGVIRPSPRDPRFLEFEDGTPYFPIGENMCWYDNDVTDYTGKGDNPGWMKKLFDSGGNFMRLWMATWGFALEWTYPEGSVLGDYTPRMDRAWALDRVFWKAEALGLKVMLCMYSHGQFSTSSNSEWLNNPYNVVNGGPLPDAAAFFTDETARKLTRNRIRYIVARWGASPALMAWELFNEVDLTDQHDAATVAAWHQEMAALIKSLDPYGRMVTSSISSFGTFWLMDQALFGDVPEIDLTQVHHYGSDLTKFDVAAEVPGMAESYSRFGKPVFFGELGVHSAGPAESLAIDPSFIGLHDLIWAPVFAASAGSGMTWWWDNLIDPNDQYFQFKAIAGFVSGIDWPGEGFEQAVLPTSDQQNLKAFAMIGTDTALVWVKNVAEKYWQLGETADPAFIEGATLDLSGLPEGDWIVWWHDTFGTTSYPAEIEVVDNTETALPVPGFSHDIALRLTRQKPAQR